MRILKSAVALTLIALLSLICLVLLLSFGCQSDTVNHSPTPSSPGLSSQPTPTTNTSQTPNIGTSPPPSTPTPADRDHDGIADIVEDQLIQKFAPVVKLHVDEQYLPANVPWYLQRVRMRFDVSHGFDDCLLNKGSVTITNLISQKNRDQVSGLSPNHSDFFLEQTDASGGDDTDSYRQETRKGTGLAAWVSYAHVKPAPVDVYPDMYDVQYIFFYAYNGDLLKTKVESAHEADMEHITVRVNKDLNTIYQIYYAAHDGEGKWYGSQTSIGIQDGYRVTNDGRPIVYSAINSHASYPWAGRQYRGTELPDDATSDGGIEWDCRQNVINLGEKTYPCEGMQWIQYSGHWGEMGETSWTNGPYGPAYQSWWDKELE